MTAANRTFRRVRASPLTAVPSHPRSLPFPSPCTDLVSTNRAARKAANGRHRGAHSSSLSAHSQYIASRTLYGLSRAGQAPRIFTKCDKHGTPWISILACSLFIGLAYINCAEGGPKAFSYLTS